MTDKIKKDIMGKQVSFYHRERTPYLQAYFSHKGKRFRMATKYENENAIRIDEMTIRMVHLMDGKPLVEEKKALITYKKVFEEYVGHQEVRVSERRISDIKRMGKFLVEKFGRNDATKLGLSSSYKKYFDWKKSYYKDNKEKRQVTYMRGDKVIKGRKHTKNGVTSIDFEIKLLVSSLRYARKYGLTPRLTPIDDYEPAVKKIGGNTPILSKEEYTKICEYVGKDNPYKLSIIRFVNNTGIRYPSELLKIKWQHVDFERSTIDIVDRKNMNTRVDSLIPMTNRTREILLSLKNREFIETKNDDLVFVDNDGVQIKSINKYWNTTLKRLDIPKEHTIRALRHLFATRLIRRGDISLKMLSEIMGHSDTQMIERTYAKWIGIKRKISTLNESEQRRDEILDGLNKET